VPRVGSESLALHLAEVRLASRRGGGRLTIREGGIMPGVWVEVPCRPERLSLAHRLREKPAAVGRAGKVAKRSIET